MLLSTRLRYMLRCIAHDKRLDAAGCVECVLGVANEDAKDAVDALTFQQRHGDQALPCRHPRACV